MRRQVSAATALLALALLLVVVLTSAECPNGCSGNGACMQKDMCNCYKNFQGNDCADHTCQFGYAHADTPKGDINMDYVRNTPGWVLTDSQQAPAGTYEYFNPGAKNNEAHFYMECSNKGLCDRATGLCACFDGFEGSACQRSACPVKCSGHGTCESLRELGVKAGGTLFGIEHPGGSVSYDLWDANSTYGCRCDPQYGGPDCNKRLCKVGVDPLFLAAGTARYETFVIHAGTTIATFDATSWVRLRLFDYHGESYITSKITFKDDTAVGFEAANKASNAAAVQAAIKAVPNLTFRDVKCESVGAGTDLADIASLRPAGTTKGMSVICQYVDNPGRHRIPEIAASYFGVLAVSETSNAVVVTTGIQGEDNEIFTTQSGIITGARTNGFLTLSTTGATFTDSGLPVVPVPTLLKIGADIILASTYTGADFTLAFPFSKTLPSTLPPIFLQASFASPTAVTLTPVRQVSTAIAVGDDKLTFAADPRIDQAAVAATVAPAPVAPAIPASYAINTGDRIFFHNMFFFIQKIWLDTGVWYARLDKPFGGNQLGSANVLGGGPSTALDIPYRVVMPTDRTKIYNYVSECSGRGLCATDTGICTCFKGYTNDNCNTQNVLAL